MNEELEQAREWITPKPYKKKRKKLKSNGLSNILIIVFIIELPNE